MNKLERATGILKYLNKDFTFMHVGDFQRPSTIIFYPLDIAVDNEAIFSIETCKKDSTETVLYESGEGKRE